jgi:hypothetical protein
MWATKLGYGRGNDAKILKACRLLHQALCDDLELKQLLVQVDRDRASLATLQKRGGRENKVIIGEDSTPDNVHSLHERRRTYGERCYRAGGCADILARLAADIDARQFNPAFPQTFPRFVQSAVWRYCAADGLDICNGNRIDDEAACDNRHCQLFRRCDRVALRANEKAP